MKLTFQQLISANISNDKVRKAVSILSGVSEQDLYVRNGAVFKEQQQNLIRQLNELNPTPLEEWAAFGGTKLPNTPQGDWMKKFQKAGVDVIGSPLEQAQKILNMPTGLRTGLTSEESKQFNQSTLPTLTKNQQHNLEWAAKYPEKFEAKYGDKTPEEVYGISPNITSEQATEADSLEQKILDAAQTKIESGIINPDVEISDEMAAQFLQQAKDEVAPYFAEQIRQKREDYTRQLGQIGEDVLAEERQLEYKYGQNLQNVQEEMARRGLAFSTIRGGKEQNLLAQTQAAIEAGRREAERRTLETGTQAERTLGTTYLPETIGVSQAPKPILGKPGVFGFEKETGTRSLFAPVGGVMGSLEKERLLSEQARQKELIGTERQLRGTAYL